MKFLGLGPMVAYVQELLRIALLGLVMQPSLARLPEEHVGMIILEGGTLLEE